MVSATIEAIDIIARIGFVTCFMFDLFLIILTHGFIRRNFGSYKWLITSFATSGIIFAAFEKAVTPVLHNFNSGFAFFTVKSIFEAPLWVMQILIAVYCGFVSLTISFLAVQFIYRYLAIFSPEKLAYFKGFRLFLWICYPLAFGTVWAFASYSFTFPDDFSNNYLEDAIMEYYGKNLTETANLAVIAYDYTNPNEFQFHWKSCYYTIAVCIIVSIQYSIMIYCGYYMQTKVDLKDVSASPIIRRLHRQFFKALVLQIITPTAILFIPIVFVMLVPFLNIEISFPSGILVSLFTLYPAADAIIFMYVVTDYSRIIKAIPQRIALKIRAAIEHCFA